MGIPGSRLLTRTLIAAVLIAAVPTVAEAKPVHRHPFGSRVLRAGMKGKDVRYLQRALTRLGISTAVDGAFGKGTKRGVRALEAERSWPVDGIVSRKEAKRIQNLLSRPRVSGSFFVQGLVSPTLTVRARHAGNAKVKVLDAAGNVSAFLPLSFGGGEARSVAWNGMTAAGAAADGIYQLRLGKSNTAGARGSGQNQPFGMHLHAFPVPGPHGFGGPDGRFGAPRAGHIHQGQDIAAPCGRKEVVDETGQVTANAYQATGAGYYVVIHGRITGTDSVYMHLQRPSWAPAGTTVYAGQQIGRVGATGDATGCHLHFERWTAPGWFMGGAAYDPLPELQYWDSYS